MTIQRTWADPVYRWFHRAGAMALVMACGGCGGDGGSPVDPPPPFTESAVLLTDFANASADSKALVLWDPAHPDTVLATVPSDETSTWNLSAASLDANLVDSGGLFNFQHQAHSLTVQSGHLVDLNLQGGTSHSTRQISNLGGVQSLGGVWPLDSTGQVGWLTVFADSGAYAVRTDMSSTQAPLSLGTGQMLDVLRDAQGAALSLVMLTGDDSGTWLDFRDVATGTQTLTRVAVTQGQTVWLGPDPAQTGLGHVILNGALRSVRWSSAGVSLDATVLDTVAVPVSAHTANLQVSYFADGLTLKSVQADGTVSTLGTLSSAITNGTASELIDAGDALIATRSIPLAPQCCVAIDSLRKSDGQPTTLYSGANSARLRGTGAGWLVFTGISGSTSAPNTTVVMHSDGSGAQTLGLFAGLVQSKQWAPGQTPAVTAVLTCTPSTTNASICGPGALTQWDLATGTSLVLGELAGQGTANAQAMEGMLATLSMVSGAPPTARDAWQFTAGQANSLVRITRNLP